MLQNHLILHLILLTQPEVTQCYEIVTHYPFRLYNNRFYLKDLISHGTPVHWFFKVVYPMFFHASYVFQEVL